MTVRDIHVDVGYGVFARFYAPRGATSPLNLFDTGERARIEGDLTRTISMMDQLVRVGLLVESTAGELLVPIRGRLVLSDSGREAPLVLMLHGNAPALFVQNTARRRAETFSSDGYRKLQRHLAIRGIASFSVNLNIVNTFELHEDYLGRVEFAFLSLMLLRRLAAPYAVAAADEMLFVRTGSGDPIRLAEALNRSPPYQTGSTLQKLHSLKSLMNDRFDFESIGLFGHSRGANAVLDYLHFVPAGRGGSGSVPSLSRGTTAINPHLLRKLAELGGRLNGHRRDDVKAIVPLQPDGDDHTIVSDSTFCLVIASSHDEDTQETAVRVYDKLNCPRAMLFLHGATHNRFNEVWRRLPSKVVLMRNNINCQRPIRILSNRSHDEIARHFIAGIFAARLAGQTHQLALFTGERRAPVRVDVERAWLFGLPFGPNVVRILDSRLTAASNLQSTSRVELAEAPLSVSIATSVFTQTVSVFRIDKPAGVTFRIEIPIQDGDHLEDVTHFGFRHAKEYDVSNRRARAAEPLFNYSIELKAGATRIGSVVPGSTFSSLVHRAYPTRQWSSEVAFGGGCYDDTTIILQSVEASMTRFLAGSRHTSSDLPRVDKIVIDLLPATGKPGNDVHILTDFALTQRIIPPPP